MSVATDDSLLQADVLICDCSGVALEYALGTERPVLFLDVPIKIRNQRFRELNIEPLELSLRTKIGKVISPEKLETIHQEVSSLIQNGVSYKENMSELRDRYIYTFLHSCETGAQYIISLDEV